MIEYSIFEGLLLVKQYKILKGTLMMTFCNVGQSQSCHGGHNNESRLHFSLSFYLSRNYQLKLFTNFQHMPKNWSYFKPKNFNQSRQTWKMSCSCTSPSILISPTKSSVSFNSRSRFVRCAVGGFSFVLLFLHFLRFQAERNFLFHSLFYFFETYFFRH